MMIEVKKFILIGCDENLKGYKSFDPENEKGMISKNVEFNEHES